MISLGVYILFMVVIYAYSQITFLIVLNQMFFTKEWHVYEINHIWYTSFTSLGLLCWCYTSNISFLYKSIYTECFYSLNSHTIKVYEPINYEQIGIDLKFSKARTKFYNSRFKLLHMSYRLLKRRLYTSQSSVNSSEGTDRNKIERYYW